VKVREGDVTDSLRSRPILCSMSSLGNSVKGFGESCIKVTDSGLESSKITQRVAQLWDGIAPSQLWVILTQCIRLKVTQQLS